MIKLLDFSFFCVCLCLLKWFPHFSAASLDTVSCSLHCTRCNDFVSGPEWSHELLGIVLYCVDYTIRTWCLWYLIMICTASLDKSVVFAMTHLSITLIRFYVISQAATVVPMQNYPSTYALLHHPFITVNIWWRTQAHRVLQNQYCCLSCISINKIKVAKHGQHGATAEELPTSSLRQLSIKF